MAPSQRILFTVMPRSLSLNADRLPISVFVSPRLYGETVLGAFPDWVDWTGTLRSGEEVGRGLSLYRTSDGLLRSTRHVVYGNVPS